jgi:hypothetical protein
VGAVNRWSEAPVRLLFYLHRLCPVHANADDDGTDWWLAALLLKQLSSAFQDRVIMTMIEGI